MFVFEIDRSLIRLKGKFRNYNNLELANDSDAIEVAMNRYETERYWLFAFKKHSQGPDNGFKEYLLDVVDTHCFFLYTFSIRTCNFVRGYVLQGTAVM